MLQGWADSVLPAAGSMPQNASVEPLLDTIVRHIPPPADSTADPFAMLVAMVEHDAFLGPVATGRIASGRAKVGDQVKVLHHTGAAFTRHRQSLGAVEGFSQMWTCYVGLSVKMRRAIRDTILKYSHLSYEAMVHAFTSLRRITCTKLKPPAGTKAMSRHLELGLLRCLYPQATSRLTMLPSINYCVRGWSVAEHTV